MKKIFTAGLLVACMAASCTSPVRAPSTFPPIVVPTHIPSPVPTSTNSLSPTQIAGTEIAPLIEPYQYQYGNADNLSPLQRTLGEEIVETLWFTQPAIWWSAQDKNTAQNILELGMNPGLGVRELHREGITGKGVTVAIIDQNMIQDHPEFRGKVVKYYDAGTNQPADRGSMHGPAVTSLLVGENVGTAPGAEVFYAAVPSWLLDAQYYADALDWIVAENEKLPDGDKIRVVSVSAIPSGMWTEYTRNTDAWEAAYERAMEAGILVLDCTYEHGTTVPCTYDLDDPEDVSKCIPNWSGPVNPPQMRINIPTRRTTAIERDVEPVFSYQYTGIGGLSWTVPYLSGVLAMGWQIDPDLTGPELLDMLYATAHVTEDNQKIIHPKAFIEMVRRTASH